MLVPLDDAAELHPAQSRVGAGAATAGPLSAKNIFSAAEVERVLTLCEVEEPIGLRDRALLEVLYSTGMRRLELVRLKLYDSRLTVPDPHP